jgi:peptide/nickel transport system permease protein
MAAPTGSVAGPVKHGRLREFWVSRNMRRLRRNRLAWLGFTLIALFCLAAIFAPLIAPPTGNCLRDLNITSSRQVYNPAGSAFWRAIVAAPPSCYQISRINFSPVPTPPGQEAIFGTSQGYDLFYGLVWGTRTMLRMGLIIEGITLLVGIVLGALSGFYGGWLDTTIQRVIDVIFAFPGLILTVVLLTILRPSVGTLILAFCVTGWASYARIVRGDILRTRALDYVDAARSLGARDWRVISQHVVPNSLTSILTIAILDLGTVPLSIAALSFIGLGLPSGYTDWGQLMNFARAWIQGPPGQPLAYWYVTALPAISIILFSLGWNLLGDSARDAFDPRSD